MKRFANISIILVTIISLFLPTGLEFGGVGEVQAATANFAIVTDYGTELTAEGTVADMINSWSPEFIVTAGDNYQGGSDSDVYPDAVGDYYGPGATSGRTDFINFSSPSNFWPVPGNHDYYSGGGDLDRYIAYFSYLPPSGAYTGATAYYYDVVRGPVHFFMIDSGSSDSSVPSYMTTQMTWLENALGASSSPWNIVMFHQPAASGSASHGSKEEMDYDYGAWGADFVIAGHNHVYERNNYRGIVHITAGAGGGNARTDWNATNLPTGAVNQFVYGEAGDTLSGAMKVSASDTSITFQYITTDSTVQETITYNRSSDNTTIQKAVDEILAGSGETLTYTLSDISYEDSDLLTNVTVTDSIPTGTTYVADSDTPEATVTPSDTTAATLITWELGSNTPGEPFLGGLALCPGSSSPLILRGGTNSKDTWIDSSNPDKNFGDENRINIDSDKIEHGLLSFDLSGIPSDAVINSATLDLMVQGGEDPDRTISIRTLDTSWTEGVGGDPCSTGATWNAPNCSDDWNGDSNFSASDYSSTEIGSISPANKDIYYSTIVTDTIQDWVDGTSTNNGFALLGVGTDAGEVKLYSSEEGTATKQPTLTVHYLVQTPGGCTETPTLLATQDATIKDNGDFEDTNDLKTKGTGDLKEVLIQFDLDGIPVGATINSATLKLRPNSAASGVIDTVHRMISAWTEDNGSWGSGKPVSGTNYDATAEGSITPDQVTVDETLSLTALVNEWISGTAPNNGIILVRDTGTDEVKYDSSEGGGASTGPRLDVSWTVDPGTNARNNSISAVGTLASNGDTITITQVLTSEVAIDNISSTGAAVDPSGLCTTLTGPTSPSDNDDLDGTSGDSVVYEWTCTVVADTIPDDFTFSAGATGTLVSDNSIITWDAAISNSVLVAPQLSFQVTIDENPGVSSFSNTANLIDDDNYTNLSSNTVTTDLDLSLIGDEVWSDWNGDGIQDNLGSDEFTGGGINVYLWSVGPNSTPYDGDDVLVDTTTSNIDSSYFFIGVATGTYYLEFEQPPGYEFSPQNVGLDDTIDSDVDPNTGYTASFAYTAGDIIDDLDAGYKSTRTCYALADSGTNDTLIKIDLLTGKGYYIGTADSTLNDGESLSLNPYADDLNNPLFTIDANVFGTINVNDGNFTAIGDGSVSCTDGTTSYTIGDMDGLAYRPGTPNPGEWYAAVRISGNDLLVRLDPTNGEVVANAFGTGVSCVRVDPPSGNTGLTDIDDLAFNTDGSVLYGVANLNDTQSHIVRIDFSSDTTAGDTVDLGEVQVNNQSVNDIEGLSIDETGAAYIITGNQNDDHDTMFTVNLTANPIVASIVGTYSGAGTLLEAVVNDGSYSPTTSYEDYEGVACYGASSVGKVNTLSSIGNFVWLDEDGDGDQDAGEPGLANVTVELWGAGVDGVIGTADDSLLRTTVTDTEGGYLFKDLTAGSYQVKIDTTQTALSSMEQTTNPINDGEDFGNQTLPYTIVLPFSTENLTADFGFNYVSSTNTNTNTGTGAIGDRIWSDTDGDGIQDAGEIGIPGVTVELWYDSNGDGVIDALYPTGGTTTTDATGNYVFDELPAGIYEVRVTDTAGVLTDYTQTGDPDHFGVTAGVNDNKTTDPILLGPGDVFVNADFGYEPEAGTTGSIGDLVWFDVNGDGNQDTGEYGIEGVTVALIDDVNGNGIWDENEPIISQTITDSSGAYSFTGLPTGADADYLVWVNDTNNVLGGADPTYDSDDISLPISTPNLSAVTDLTTAGDDDQDFGYTADGWKSGLGTIGDFVYYDRNGDGSYDPDGADNILGTGDDENGLEGVIVELYDATGTTLIGSTVTDENGHYYFTGLTDDDYVVKITNPDNFTSTGVLNGMTFSDDPDATVDGVSAIVTISGGSVDLDQDFGLEPDPEETASSISGTLWEDMDANGVLDETSPTYYEDVTIDLYDDLNGNGVVDPGEPVVGTTVTDASGDYSFTNLPAGDYIVDVTDTNNVLEGTWHSLGTTGIDNNSQVDPYAISLDWSDDNETADFGYYSEPAAVGDFVWVDLNNNGIQDAGEPGIEGVEVTLTITYPNAEEVILVTTTDSWGAYRFDNLLQDEDFDGSGSGEPVYALTAEIPSGYTIGLNDEGTDDLDSDGVETPEGSYVVIGVSPNSPLVMGGYNPEYDFGMTREPAVIGNYVWLDEDGDGDQDAGEAGIPNVEVNLSGTDIDGNPITLTTYTDANGGYLFDGLPPSDDAGYTVTVTPPTGLEQTYDEDIPVSLDNATTVVLAAGDEHLTADFGYNWSTTAETGDVGVPPEIGATGAIGDRVWIDADGDGVQDPGEAGLGGVTVNLYTPGPDGIFGTGDDVLEDTTTTNADGTYIFDDLDPDAYIVQVSPPPNYDQTGDPDGTLDNQTTEPILLAPGDVYVNADFGYNPSGDSSAIGDFVWIDHNGDGIQDSGEGGIPGVTVALILDDGDGVYEPGVDQIIATDITDGSGNYLFPDLPAGIYFVAVTDTENVLGELAPTYDGDNDGSLDELSKVTVDGVNDDLDQDFGYAPPGQDHLDGLLGDQIWLDDGNGTFEIGEGLEGVRVVLTDPGVDGILGTDDDYERDTYTDENGNYYFGNLDPDLSYEVTVDTTTLPPGVTNTVDPDGTPDSTTIRNLSVTGSIDLDADFAYVADTPNTISGTLWEDTDADGTLDGGESGRYEGVTVVLRDANGDIVASTETDVNGDYSFSGLPDGTYTVDVTDDYNILDGTWHSDGPNDGADNNSQDAPYTVTVNGGQTDTTGDFGYYIEPGAVGNIIWDDLNDNGIQDSGEIGIEGVQVTLTITYPNGEEVNLVTSTDPSGIYRFDNLLQDEDYTGDGSVEPVYTLTVEIPSGYTISLTDIGTDDQDSDGVESAEGSFVVIGTNPNSPLVMGGYNPDYDFGLTSNPTAEYLPLNFMADYAQGGVRLSWDASNPLIGTIRLEIGFNGDWEQISIIEYKSGVTHYEWIDFSTNPGVEYSYRLHVFHMGEEAFVGPISITGPYNFFLPILNN